MTLPIIGVEAENVRLGHFIPVAGLTARIHRIGLDEANAVHLFHWTIIDPVPADVKDLGVLRVPVGGLVECVRYADWVAARNAASAAEKAEVRA